MEPRHRLRFDSTVGGIGGCPYCGNGQATGMAATEDVVAMLEGMGIATGVDITKLIRVAWELERVLGRRCDGHVSQAGARPGPDELYDPNLPLIQTFAQARHFIDGASAYDGATRPWKEPIPEAEGTGPKLW